MGSDWAEKIAKQIYQKVMDQRRAEELELERSRLMTTNVPGLWKELRIQIKKKAQEANSQTELAFGQSGNYFSVDDLPLDLHAIELRIETAKQKIKVAYLDALKVVNVSRVTPSPQKNQSEIVKSFHFEVSDHQVWFKEDVTDGLVSAESVAESILETLV